MNRIEAAAEAVTQYIGGFHPETPEELDLFLGGLPAYFSAAADAFRSVADTLSDQFPIENVVPERLREIAATIGGMSDFAAEARAVHRAAHDSEIERREDPRHNEGWWDTSNR